MTGFATATIILAAGKGTRMKSDHPKVMHKIAGLPIVGHVIQAARTISGLEPAVVLAPHMDDVRQIVAPCPVFEQTEQLGTGHATLAAKAHIESMKTGCVIVMFGDTPFISSDTLKGMVQSIQSGHAVTVLGFETSDPTGYGRLLMDGDALFDIVEHKDATEAQKRVTFCNSGVVAMDVRHAISLLEAIDCINAASEYYLPDVVKIAVSRGLKATALAADQEELVGINSRNQLADAEAQWQARKRQAIMAEGATLSDPGSVYFAHDTVIGRDVVIEPHVFFGPGVTVEDHVTIHAFSHLEGAYLHAGCDVGPYARLRPGSVISKGARIGNFVEVKNATFGEGAKANHLSYIGDANVGMDANIGAGTITCNYDGFLKSQTTIGAGAFIGSNSALVAPVVIGDGAIVGAGSVMTRNVPDHALAVARGEVIMREEGAVSYRERKAAEKASKQTS